MIDIKTKDEHIKKIRKLQTTRDLRFMSITVSCKSFRTSTWMLMNEKCKNLFMTQKTTIYKCANYVFISIIYLKFFKQLIRKKINIKLY